MSDGPADRDDAGWDPGPRETDSRDEGEVDRGVEDPSDAEGDPGGADEGDFDEEPSLASILGAEQEGPRRREITPGSPSLENAVFVLLGVLFTVLVLYRAWTVFVG